MDRPCAANLEDCSRGATKSQDETGTVTLGNLATFDLLRAVNE